MSADLAGSTAFKAGAGKERTKGGSQPIWVQATRHFYVEFPRLVLQSYETDKEKPLLDKGPMVWKTVGDEIIFCCRINSLEHLSCCMTAFLKAINDFGLSLEANYSRNLDIKGAAWLAAFPSPNVTVSLDASRYQGDQPDELFEQGADANPGSFDFLGNGIDSGFRVTSRSAPDRCVVSAELAWLLAQAADKKLGKSEFSYHSRHSLKGVLRDRPYPIFSVDTERDEKKRLVRYHERQLGNHKALEPIAITQFLQSFMEDEGMELPMLHGSSTTIIPASYSSFREAWIREREGIERVQVSEAEAEADEHAGGTAKLPQAVTKGLEQALADNAEVRAALTRRIRRSKP